MTAASDPVESKGEWKTFSEVISSWDPESGKLMNKLAKYCGRLALTNEASKGGHVFINGKYAPLTDVSVRFSEPCRGVLMFYFIFYVGLVEGLADGYCGADSVPPGSGKRRSHRGEGNTADRVEFQIWTNEVVDSEELDMSNWFHDLPTTSATRNAHIYPSSSGDSALRIISLSDARMPGVFVYHRR